MSLLHRRSFIASTLGGVAAACSGPLWAGDRPAVADLPPTVKADSPASLFLTWQKDPTTTMTIQWIGPLQHTAVHYGFESDSVWQSQNVVFKPFPDTDLSVHRCQLTGLTPGAEYVFQVGDSLPLHRFRTMPAKATDTIQFVSGGDCATNEHTIATNILAAKQEPYFALLGGDLAYDNGTSPKTFVRFLENYSRHMVDPKGRLIPMLSCIGNHEVKGDYNAKRTDGAHYLSVFDGLFDEKTYGVIDIGDYLSLVLLDTGHIAPIGGEQTDWLAGALADRQERPHLIVANHVPAYPSFRVPPGWTGNGEENRRHWCPLFERYNVDVVLEHHHHTYKRTHPVIDGLKDKNGVVYLGDGSWGRLLPPNNLPRDLSYIAANNRTYHMSVHRLEGDQRFHVALEESGRVADVCMTASKRPARRG
jgi:hypothetical protein